MMENGDLKERFNALSQVSRAIREQEKGLKNPSSLVTMRKGEIRRELRIIHLALAYLEGTPYSAVEKTRREIPNGMWSNVVRELKTVDSSINYTSLNEWRRS